jgi:glycosyltransferase involved in cell wall biosynthesis
MPVYNAEKYLKAAIQSVLNQTYKDFELICVNDGSKDNSATILDEYMTRDNRIVVIHQQNSGICAARNAGLKVAKGDYIAFIDNDDLYLENLLEDNLSLALKYNADIVHFGAFFPQNENSFAETVSKERLNESQVIQYSFSEALEEYPIFRQKYLANVWTGLFKKKLLNNLRFNELYRFGFEDWMFNIEAFFRCKTFLYNPTRYYVHFARINYSTSQKWDANRLESFLDGKKKEVALCENNGMEKNTIALIVAYYVMLISRDIWGKPNGLTHEEKKCFMKQLHWEDELKELSWMVGSSKKQYLLAKTYKNKQWGLQELIVKFWRLKCRLTGKYF